jgi:hypothetical protein
MRRICLGLWLLCPVLGLGCGDDDSDDPIDDFEACGGDPEGEWTLEAMYSDVDTDLLGMSMLGTRFASEPSCAGAVHTVERIPEGVYRFGPGSQYRVDGTLTYDIELTVTGDCFTALSPADNPGVQACEALEFSFPSQQVGSAANCVFTEDACECSVSTTKTVIDEVGTFRVEGETLTLNGQDTEFCVDGDSLQIRRDVSDRSILVVLSRG